MRCTSAPTATAARTEHHRRPSVAVCLQSGPVLCGSHDVCVLSIPGAPRLHRQASTDRPLSLWTTGGPGWPCGGHSAAYLRYQRQPGDGARETRTARQLGRDDDGFSVDSFSACYSTCTFVRLFDLAATAWISQFQSTDKRTCWDWVFQTVDFVYWRFSDF